MTSIQSPDSSYSNASSVDPATTDPTTIPQIYEHLLSIAATLTAINTKLWSVQLFMDETRISNDPRVAALFPCSLETTYEADLHHLGLADDYVDTMLSVLIGETTSVDAELSDTVRGVGQRRSGVTREQAMGLGDGECMVDLDKLADWLSVIESFQREIWVEINGTLKLIEGSWGA